MRDAVMKRIAICCLVLVFLAASASGYQVHEEPEEDDETIREKRQQTGASLIDSIFNIPIAAIKQTSQAAQTLSAENAGTIDSILKIPVTTLEAVSSLIKNRQQNRYQTTLSPTSQPSRRSDVNQTSDEVQRRRRVEVQREQQRRWQEQLNRRRMAQLIQHNRQMQQQIAAEDERAHHSFYRDPFGFNALTKWVVGPHGVFNGHAGHGDGHVYQYYNQEKPLHFGGQRRQDTDHTISAKSTKPLDSTISSSTSTSSSSDSSPNPISTSPTSTNPPKPTFYYEVNENVDEGINPFTWPNWFGIINVLASTTATTQQSSDEKLQSKIAAKKAKVRFDEPALQNKIAPKDKDQLKDKYYARKNSIPEEELTGNEIDGDVSSGERLSEKGARILFPVN